MKGNRRMMILKACKCLKAICCAEKLIGVLTALRITVFAAALIYSATMFLSLIRQRVK
jgi:hypothetical protein